MRFFNTWLNTEPPGPMRLVDIGLLFAIIPHLFMLRTPMIIYLIVAVVLLSDRYHEKKWRQWVIVVGGIVALALSFISEYNFSNFSRLLVFVSFITSLLIFAIILQRMQGILNFYMKISPALLLLLSFFFFNSIPMLVYAIAALFVMTLLLVWQSMASPLKEALRVTGILFMMALPVVVVLFMVFPRISFEKRSFGFQNEIARHTGHDGTMHLDSSALLVPSERVVMEVLFDGSVPGDSFLYFRGSVLYNDNTATWTQLPTPALQRPIYRSRLSEAADVVSYDVTLYPHGKRWLYVLDMPIAVDDTRHFNNDLIATSKQNIVDKYRYHADSALRYRLRLGDRAIFPEASLNVDLTRDPITAEAVSTLIDEQMNDRERADALLRYFQRLGLSYTLKPDPMDLEHPVDDFLHGKKKGYCVHFAAAFAVAARMADIPSRIVTGYKASRDQRINNYLVVKQKDAHAWVELYLDNEGWVRFEPTAVAPNIDLADQNTQASAAQTQSTAKDELFPGFRKLNLYYMYIKFTIETWVLQYNRFKQTMLLKKLLNDTIFVLKVAASMLLLVAISILIIVILRRPRCGDPLLCLMKELEKKLLKRGLQRKPDETLHEFLVRSACHLETAQAEALRQIDRLYHAARYGMANSREQFERLQHSVKRFRPDADPH